MTVLQSVRCYSFKASDCLAPIIVKYSYIYLAKYKEKFPLPIEVSPAAPWVAERKKLLFFARPSVTHSSISCLKYELTCAPTISYRHISPYFCLDSLLQLCFSPIRMQITSSKNETRISTVYGLFSSDTYWRML